MFEPNITEESIKKSEETTEKILRDFLKSKPKINFEIMIERKEKIENLDSKNTNDENEDDGEKNENNLKKFSRENILKALTDQNSTIYLQKQLRTISSINIDYIINQLKGIFREIMKDKNGNYFCKDLFKECTQEQRIKILNELYQTLSEDCLNNYACHPIQTLIERASSEMEYKLILTTFNDYNKLLFASLDPNGAYTIQRIIERIPDRYRQEFNFIFSSFIGFTSRKKYGIVTVKKFISETKSDKVTEQILNFIEQNFLNLAVDQYANYLIQFLLEKWNNTPEGNKIKKLIETNFDKMCKKKYSSFICENYINMIHPEKKNELINSLNIKKIKESNNYYSLRILKFLGVNIESNYILRLSQKFNNSMDILNYPRINFKFNKKLYLSNNINDPDNHLQYNPFPNNPYSNLNSYMNIPYNLYTYNCIPNLNSKINSLYNTITDSNYIPDLNSQNIISQNLTL